MNESMVPARGNQVTGEERDKADTYCQRRREWGGWVRSA